MHRVTRVIVLVVGLRPALIARQGKVVPRQSCDTCRWAVQKPSFLTWPWLLDHGFLFHNWLWFWWSALVFSQVELVLYLYSFFFFKNKNSNNVLTSPQPFLSLWNRRFKVQPVIKAFSLWKASFFSAFKTFSLCLEQMAFLDLLSRQLIMPVKLPTLPPAIKPTRRAAHAVGCSFRVTHTQSLRSAWPCNLRF